jgi:ABC-type phosphate/phosphonate transport system permease subunit
MALTSNVGGMMDVKTLWLTLLLALLAVGWLVGGGGLGQAIYNNMQLGFYPRLSTLILLVYALVPTSDWIGEGLRLRVA